MLKQKGIKLLLILLLTIAVIPSGFAFAVPTLQLDIAGGTYDLSTQTIIAGSDPFTLYALLKPDKSNNLSDTYFISAAVLPAVDSPGANLGSFVFDQQTINVTGDMIYGTPPIETLTSPVNANADPGDLASHSVYPTYFSEFAFQFSLTDRANVYDTQTYAGAGPTLNPNGNLYYHAFTVDTSLLDPNYVIHFDLYNTALAKCSSTDLDVTQFAPFSHDAQSGGGGNKVPEPGLLILFGTGLLGLNFFRLRIFKK